jgi:hypothetical protein
MALYTFCSSIPILSWVLDSQTPNLCLRLCPPSLKYFLLLLYTLITWVPSCSLFGAHWASFICRFNIWQVCNLNVLLIYQYFSFFYKKKKTTDKNLASSFSYAYASALGI